MSSFGKRLSVQEPEEGCGREGKQVLLGQNSLPVTRNWFLTSVWFPRIQYPTMVSVL